MSKTPTGEFTPDSAREMLRVLNEYGALKGDMKRGLGGRLSRHLRGSKSVRAFAEECGVSATYISLIENDLSRVSARFLRLLLKKVPARAAGSRKHRKKS